MPVEGNSGTNEAHGRMCYLRERVASAQHGPLYWHLLFISVDVEFLCMEYGNQQTRSTSYRVLSNCWYMCIETD